MSTLKGKFDTRVVGITGGIGSGKSAAAEAFGALGIDWIDADQIARDVVTPGAPALAAIAERYGPAILRDDGTLNRRALRARIFEDTTERQWLERETHPRIRQSLLQHLARMRATGAPYCLLVSPLLIESGQIELVDRILVVDAPRDVQIQRTLARDGVDQRQVESILASQISRERRLAAADDVIDNDGDRQHLIEQVAQLDARYRQRFASARR